MFFIHCLYFYIELLILMFNSHLVSTICLCCQTLGGQKKVGQKDIGMIKEILSLWGTPSLWRSRHKEAILLKVRKINDLVKNPKVKMVTNLLTTNLCLCVSTLLYSLSQEYPFLLLFCLVNRTFWIACFSSEQWWIVQKNFEEQFSSNMIQGATSSVHVY